jgi:hypothetical protein
MCNEKLCWKGVDKKKQMYQMIYKWFKKEWTNKASCTKHWFQIQPSDLEHPQGEGDIKEDDKGGKNSLEVKKGTRVQLIRLTDNPKGKWLVKLSATGLGIYIYM